ncbi:MAG: FlgO family outer membrane protein [Candidatus Eiseniibacteriota bacterium]
MRERIGSFRLRSRLGEGGMGVVYAADDERLGRRVAIKMIREAARKDERDEARERFWREARAAARISHPNVCQLYDVGEEDGELWIAMELLEGTPLATRLSQGPLPLGEAGPIALGVLSALEAIHRHEIVHRDLKPTNVFLTPHGVKLLDFGLARTYKQSAVETDPSITRTGYVMGTPRYMSPEQWKGEAIDARTDLFAVGTLLYEMLAGSPPFHGDSSAEIRHSVLFHHPPVLSGPPAVAAADRVIQKALAKSASDRFSMAQTMAEELRAALALLDDDTARARTVRRLIVLPFRCLRPDPECDFLTFSLPDAITASLAGIETLVVRSHLSAARYVEASPDLKQIAAEAEVDLVLTGTLLRAGDQMRVATQLLEAPSGTVVWTQTTQVSMGDLFQLQDSLARHIVDSLSLPLAGRERSALQRDVPATAKAYEFYLRGNQLGRNPEGWPLARDFYLQCLEEDPKYAPAWAQLGRIYRVMAKYHTGENAEENTLRAADAFNRALSLNPDLSLAHNLYVYLEVEMGRCQESMVRLLDRARHRANDADLYAGLVQACRYCGLLEPSAAAYEHAKRLDPAVRTSVCYTYYLLGDYERAIGSELDEDRYLTSYALMAQGKIDEAAVIYRKMLERGHSVQGLMIFNSQLAVLTGDRDTCLKTIQAVVASPFRDPEGLYFMGRTAAYIHERDLALKTLARVVDGGYYQPSRMTRDPWLDSIRAEPEFIRLLRLAEAKRRDAVAAFLEHGGDKILGVSPSG